jgi:hypothetical protein
LQTAGNFHNGVTLLEHAPIPRLQADRYTARAPGRRPRNLEDAPRWLDVALDMGGSRISPSGSFMAGRRVAVLGVISDMLSAAPIKLGQHFSYARAEGASAKKGST